MYKLVISDDEGKTTVVPLIRDEVTIGRKEGNTIRLTERNVSRFHARVMRENDSFRIEDLGSLVGTKVNNELIKSKVKPIAPGDQIVIGDYSLSIRSDVGAEVPLGRQMAPGDEAGIGKVTSHARLVMLTDPTPGHEVDLVADLYVIGRSEEANFRIQDSSISRAHARVDLEGGQWTISDLDSINGILVNGAKKDDYVLKAGDVIELGTVRLRFVAPGEPYEFNPDAKQVVSRPAAAKKATYRTAVFAVAGAAVILAGIVIAVILLSGRQPGDTGGTGGGDDTQTYETLVERGKDRMQNEEWAEAARMFALAIQKRTDSRAAREMKDLAIAESDAQGAFNAGLAANEAKNWAEGVKQLASIPRSSQYYDLEQLRRASSKLCEELLVTAGFSAQNGDFAGAEKALQEIGGIPEAPARCREEKDRLWQKVRERAPIEGDGGAGRGAGDGRTRPEGIGAVKKGSALKAVPGNPYSADIRGPAGSFARTDNPYAKAGGGGSKQWDPLDEARKAMRQGDMARAIAILEHGGNSRPVLVLLAHLYQQKGNADGYKRVAEKFIKLYPDDPATGTFKRNL